MTVQEETWSITTKHVFAETDHHDGVQMKYTKSV